MGKTTDNLLNLAKNSCNGSVDKRDLDDILAMGERTSVRIFTATLRAAGVEAQYFDPLDDMWPIITDDDFMNANPILKHCEERINRFVLPIIEKGVVPVIAGFVGKTLKKKVTTLGRGGSDTTAFIIARVLDADEIILVSGAEGIMTADPKLVKDAKILPAIDVATLTKLADSGKKFIHRKALRFKSATIDIRVLSNGNKWSGAKGTIISGEFSTYLDIVLECPSPVVSISIVGSGISRRPNILQELAKAVKMRTSLLGVSLDCDSIILYARENEEWISLLDKLHAIVLKHDETIAMSVRNKLAFLKIKGVGLEETPGIIGEISEILRVHEINIFGLLTITSSIMLFVDWKKRNLVRRVVKAALEKGS
jgi:aspartate kinase